MRIEEAAEKKKEHKAFIKIWRVKQDLQLANGVTACKSEQARKKKVKKLMLQGIPIPPELDVPIPDPSKFWIDTDVTWLAQVAAKKAKKSLTTAENNKDKEDNKEETRFIVDPMGDPALQADFIPFENDVSNCNRQMFDSDSNCDHSKVSFESDGSIHS